MIVYISIGNSDDKLTQAEWAGFVASVDENVDWVLEESVAKLHGRWFSAPDVPWQSACWCVELITDPHLGTRADWLRKALTDTATEYRQRQIAWAVADTEFLTGGTP